MHQLTYLTNRPDQVLQALRTGEIMAIETATEQTPDLFVLYAIESGLLDALANSFPDPRTQQPEIPMRILLAAGIAGHFAGLYALSQSPYALHSPRLLTELGIQIAVNQPGQGLSRKGTQQETPFHGDVLRKLLTHLAHRDKQKKHLPGQCLLDWYNASVGHRFCQVAHTEPTLHILDCTDLTVPLSNANYEQAGITGKNQTAERGYKLATLRSLLDVGAICTALAWASIETHDVPVTADLLRNTPHLRPGDTLLHDRGFLDGATLTHLKKERHVDVCTGLKRDMNCFKAAVVAANASPGAWEAHPTRKHQQIQLVSGLGGLWSELGVALNIVVVRWRDKASQEYEYIGFATTDLSLSARQVITLYQTRPEIEEDYRQLKSGSWRIDCFHTTQLVQILWHVIMTLLAYNLFQVYANTEVGQAFARQTKQKIEREQRRHSTTYLLVYTHDSFGMYETKSLLYIMLDLPDDVRKKIRCLLPQKLD